MKIPLGMNVRQAAKERIDWTFDNFKKVYISFSGGKDSSVLTHLVMEEAIKRNRRVGIMLIDLEGQYKMTMDHVDEMFEMYEDYADIFHIALPMNLRNAVSVYEPFWTCWEEGKEDIWVRQMSKRAISDVNYFPFFEVGMEFEEFVPLFGEWYSEGESCACMVGIRTDESLNRYRTIASTKKETLDGKQYSTRVIGEVYNVYPIYDWKTEDIWTFHGKNKNYPYNKVYDYMGMAGLKLSQMRLCQPYGDDQRRGLWLFHLIEPETWSKVVARVNGANGGTLYIQEWGNINGYRGITKPEGHTWETFARMLINSMPPQTSEHYANKVFTFEEWWKKKGYPEGLPDSADYKMEQKGLAPSWRRVCKSLLRNDYWCKGLGFSQHKSSAYQKYMDLKKKQREEANFQI